MDNITSIETTAVMSVHIENACAHNYFTYIRNENVLQMSIDAFRRFRQFFTSIFEVVLNVFNEHTKEERKKKHHCVYRRLINLPTQYVASIWIGLMCIYMWLKWRREKKEPAQKASTFLFHLSACNKFNRAEGSDTANVRREEWRESARHTYRRYIIEISEVILIRWPML